MKFRKVVIVGVGLIGGSIGKAILSRGLAENVAGVCRRQESLDKALKEKSFSAGFINDYAKAVDGADLIIIATPVHTIKPVLVSLAECVRDKNVIVTDVGSTKKEIVEFAERFSGNFSFVGGHPLAGSEKTGVEYSTSDLFENSVCVLTENLSTDEPALKALRALWGSMGAEVLVMSPDKHDEILAFTSHLPHIMAYALSGCQKAEYYKFMSTGFRDTTRIASSDPGLWTDIFMSNRDNVLKSIECFKKVLSDIENGITEKDEQGLKKSLGSYKKVRDDAFQGYECGRD
ncbi:MAG: prephenate dehydrogenase/arogenate dehydrogenase family protein [Candidatus Omnitrophota bacterium]